MSEMSKIICNKPSYLLVATPSVKKPKSISKGISCSFNKECDDSELSNKTKFKVSLATCAAAIALTLSSPCIAKEQAPELFDPMKYLGRWYEVASLKTGFAGEGQQDCHCTQGVYMSKENKKGYIEIEVSTFCFHGGPNGKLSGIQGAVTCADPYGLSILPEFKSDFERQENIAEKCVLKFPSIPIIPAETYDVISTDYKTYALVQGAADRGFVQIYSRKPNPGKAFIEKQKAVLAKFGYPVDKIIDTPQDCPVIEMDGLMGMMKNPDNESIMTNTLPSPFANLSGPQFAGNRNPIEMLKDFFKVLKKS